MQWERTVLLSTVKYPKLLSIWPWVKTYDAIFGWMNIHLPSILMFTRVPRFWPMAIWEIMGERHQNGSASEHTVAFLVLQVCAARNSTHKTDSSEENASVCSVGSLTWDMPAVQYKNVFIWIIACTKKHLRPSRCGLHSNLNILPCSAKENP